MDFYYFLETVYQVIPAEYADTAAKAQPFLAGAFLLFSLLTCLLGYKLHKVWITCTFFVVGFFAGYLTMLLAPGANIYLFIAIGAAVGVLAGVLALKLYHAGLFAFNAVMVYVSVSGLLTGILPEAAGIIIGILIGIAAGVLVVKFKFIVTMLVTAASGAFAAAPAILAMADADDWILSTLLSLFLMAAGICLQFFLERKHLKRLKSKAGSVHKPGQGAAVFTGEEAAASIGKEEPHTRMAGFK